MDSKIPIVYCFDEDYATYAEVKFKDAFLEEEIKDAYLLKCETFSSAYIENKGNGKFEVKPLPVGAPVPPQKTLDGENLLPLFRGGDRLSRSAIFWHFPGYLNTPVIRGRELDVRTGFRSRPVSVIRKGDWKLHLFHEEWQLDGGRARVDTNNAVELYHLGDDIGERVNLANRQPAKRDELLADLQTWIKSTGALIPAEPNPLYDSAARSAKREGKPRKTQPD